LEERFSGESPDYAKFTSRDISIELRSQEYSAPPFTGLCFLDLSTGLERSAEIETHRLHNLNLSIGQLPQHKVLFANGSHSHFQAISEILLFPTVNPKQHRYNHIIINGMTNNMLPLLSFLKRSLFFLLLLLNSQPVTADDVSAFIFPARTP
jgi:hypothetical protein